MKIPNFKYLVILVTAIALFNGCSSDETAVVSPYVGNYTISKATTAATFTVPTVQMGTIPIPAGQDITAAIQMALLSQVPCTTTSLVELRQDFTMYVSCNKANPLNAGTWQEISATEIKLNMNSTAIPSSPAGLPLTVTGVVKDATKLTGRTSVPLPKAMISAMIAPMGLTLATTAPEVFQVDFNLEFTIKN